MYIHVIRVLLVDAAPAMQFHVANEFIKSKCHSAFIIVIGGVTYIPALPCNWIKVALDGK